jgi:aspartyl-tRNA(Asn)/glutamyl-tRNA(Gln) amidotransferase subunit A
MPEVSAPVRTLSAAAAAVRAGEITSAQLVDEAITAADAWDPTIGSYIARYDDQARAAAEAADAAVAAGKALGPLHGVPIGVKDILAAREGPTTAQSVVADPEWGIDGDAVAVARLRDAGAIVMGKTSTMEFAVGLPDASKPFPVPRNPWDPTRYTGGSSSGSASGLATGMFLGALGTDTGGSIRMPAAFCGVTGLKPTFGRVPKSGCLPLGFSLDHVGPMARSARDCALMLSVMAGADASDRQSLHAPVEPFVDALSGELSGLRIGFDPLLAAAEHCREAAIDVALEDAVAALRDLGADVVDVELPFYAELCTADIVILISEGAAFHQRDLRARWDDYAAGTRMVLGSAPLYSGADYVQAQRAREVGGRAFLALLEDRALDVVITPTLGVQAVPIDEAPDVALGPKWAAMFTPYWNALGLPAVTVPMGFTGDGLPMGLQIAGRALDEGLVLRVADAYQRVTDWHLQAPEALVFEGGVDVKAVEG